MPTKGANGSQNTTEADNLARAAAKSKRQPKKGSGHNRRLSNDELDVFNEGRERQIAAIRKDLVLLKAEGRRREFLNVMLSVYGSLEKADRQVEGKFLTPLQATFRKIEAVVGLDALRSAWGEWRQAKDDFVTAERNHPLRKYCAEVEAAIAERTRQSEEHLTQSLGALLNQALLISA